MKKEFVGWFVLGLVALLLASIVIQELLSEPLIPPYSTEPKR